MHCLLTGATGFLGSHLLHALIENEYNVSIIKRTTSSLDRIVDVIDQCHCYDIDQQSLESIFNAEKFDLIIHTACDYGRTGKPINAVIETNIAFSVRLLELANVNGVSGFINTDTMLPPFVSAYALSKSQFVDWLRYFSSWKMKVINMKIEHMYGPGDDSKKFMNWMLSQLRNNVPSIELTKGEQKRDFIYIDDVVSAFLIVIRHINEFQKYSEFQVGTGYSVPLRDIVEVLVSLYKSKDPTNNTKIEYGKIPYRENEPMEIIVDNRHLMELGWKPKTGLREGINNLLLRLEKDEL